jgi:hypothetical protein
MGQDSLAERLRNRAEELRKELNAGRAELQAITAREQYLRDTILRVSGAIQVIEEVIGTNSHDLQTPISTED